MIFFKQRPKGADNFKLFVREGARGADRVLVDPTLPAAPTGHVSLDWWRASPDGRHVVYGLVEGRQRRFHAAYSHRRRRQRLLTEQIPNTQDANPQWLDDGSGFFYNQLTGAVDTPERFLDSQARFHRLGSDPACRSHAHEARPRPRDRLRQASRRPISSPSAVPVTRLLLLSDVRPEARAFIAPLADVIAGRAHWTRFAGFDDEVTDVDLDGEDLYLLVNKGTPRGRLVKTSAAAPSIATARRSRAAGTASSSKARRGRRDGLYLQIMDGGISRLQRLGADGQVTEIALPFDGTIGVGLHRADEDGALLSFQGWLTPAGIYSVDTARPRRRHRHHAQARHRRQRLRGQARLRHREGRHEDPLLLIYRKGMKLDGSAPTWISAYGSYGSPPIRRPSPAARWRWSMPAPSSATPTCAAAANTAANGTRPGNSPTSPTPGAI